MFTFLIGICKHHKHGPIRFQYEQFNVTTIGVLEEFNL